MTSVEVIIPVFNDQSRLNRLLESLTAQTLPPSSFSVTIVDNGSDSPVFLPEGLPFHCRLMFCSKHGSCCQKCGMAKYTSALGCLYRF